MALRSSPQFRDDRAGPKDLTGGRAPKRVREARYVERNAYSELGCGDHARNARTFRPSDFSAQI